jgi:hypothetical protein
MLILSRSFETIREFLLIIGLYQNSIQIEPKNAKFNEWDKIFISNVNKIARHSQLSKLNDLNLSDPVLVDSTNLAELLVRVCSQTFSMIEPEYLTLDLVNCFYNT